MVPARVIVLAALPLTLAGKVDRGALPRPEEAPRRVAEAPRGAAEEALALIWSEVLQVREIDRTDHFFERGGHSLLAMSVVNRVRRRFGIDVPLRALFDRPVFADFAALLPLADSAASGADRLARLLDEVEASAGIDDLDTTGTGKSTCP